MQMEQVHKDIAEREAAKQKLRAAAEAQQAALFAEELEETRKAAWWTNIVETRMDELSAQQFTPTWIAEQIPEAGWPPGVSPSDFSYRHSPDHDAINAVVPNEASPLVKGARQAGYDV